MADLEDASVRLQTPTEDDEAVLYRLAAELDTWEERTPRAPAPLTLAEFRRNRSDQADGRSMEFMIIAGGVVAGRAAIFDEDPLVRQAEVGLGLVAEARGQGYGTEALRQLVEFAFVRRNLRRVHLAVVASNAGAIASYRKVGFVEEGRRREHCWVRGHYEDEVLMGLLRSQWAPAR
ncbi:MAG: GNAT family protein [Jatrophihabitantaceae bacterium]